MYCIGWMDGWMEYVVGIVFNVIYVYASIQCHFSFFYHYSCCCLLLRLLSPQHYHFLLVMLCTFYSILYFYLFERRKKVLFVAWIDRMDGVVVFTSVVRVSVCVHYDDTMFSVSFSTFPCVFALTHWLAHSHNHSHGFFVDTQ